MAGTKKKLLNAGLILTSLIGYLEWGTENHTFLFQAEWVVLSKLIQDPMAVVHPFTLLPLFGQIVLLITLFQERPNRIMTFVGLACLGILLFLMFFIGVISFNYKIFLSTLPFVITAVLTVRENLKKLHE